MGSELRGKIDDALLQFCLQHDDSPNLQNDYQIPQRDPEDYKWLREAMASLEGNVVKIMKLLEKLTEENTEEEIKQTLEDLQFYAEDIDDANDMAKIPNGLEVIAKYMAYKLEDINDNNTQSKQIRATAAWVFSTLAQNNPFCQKVIFNRSLFKKIMHFLQVEKEEIVLSKLLGCVSAMIRDFPPVQKELFTNIKETLSILSELSSKESLKMKVEVVSSHLSNVNAEEAEVTQKDLNEAILFYNNLVDTNASA